VSGAGEASGFEWALGRIRDCPASSTDKYIMAYIIQTMQVSRQSHTLSVGEVRAVPGNARLLLITSVPGGEGQPASPISGPMIRFGPGA
jgi:hypothetical protein